MTHIDEVLARLRDSSQPLAELNAMGLAQLSQLVWAGATLKDDPQMPEGHITVVRGSSRTMIIFGPGTAAQLEELGLLTDIPELWRDQFLATRMIPGRGLCAVQRFIHTTGLLTNVKFDGVVYDFDARYCYPIMLDAMSDLMEWDGKGDPPGEWVKEKVSERGKQGQMTGPGDIDEEDPNYDPEPLPDEDDE